MEYITYNIKRTLKLGFIIFLFLTIFIPISSLSQTSNLQFTEEEKAWISTHPILNVGNESYWPPIDFVVDGKPMGYSIDLMNLVAKEIGIEINYINDFTWIELLDKLNNGEIDVLPAISKTSEREAYLKFSNPYIDLPYVKVINSNNPESEFIDLSDKTIGVIKGSNVASEVLRKYPNIDTLHIKTIVEGIYKVSTGEVDVFIENIAVISYYLNESYIPNIKLNSDNLNFLESSNVYMAVLKKNEILGTLIDKGIDAIPKDKIIQIRDKWMPNTIKQTENLLISDKETGFLKSSDLWKVILGAFILFVILYFIFNWAYKRFITENVALEFGSRKFRLKTHFYLTLLVIVVSCLGWFAIVYIKAEFTKNIKLQLENDLGSANGRLEFWLNERKDYLKSLGHHQKLIDLTNELKEVSKNHNTIQYNIVHNKLERFYEENNYQGNFIINQEGINIGAVDVSSVGNLNFLAKNNSELLNRAFKGEVVFVPPIKSNDKGSDKNSLMYFLIPIEDTEHHIIACIIQEIDPAYGFSEILQLSHVGESGESYIFNREGRMLSTSRFENELKALGVFHIGESGAPYIEIKDPGGNLTKGYESKIPYDKQPLTIMATSAIGGEKSVNTDGYNDYRGVPVMGAWMWIDELELGLATEIDEEEALSLFYFIRLSAIIVLGITLIFIIGSILFVLSLGEQANVALIKAKDELEERVDKRTDELSAANQQIQGIVDSLADALIIINEFGIVQSFSPSAEKMFQYKKEEIIGFNISKLMPSPHREDHNSYLDNYKRTGKAKIIGMEREVNGVRKDGSVFPASLKVSKVITENKRLYVGLMSDLTDKKKSELRLKSQSAALKSTANGVVITKTNGEIVWTNPAFSLLTGYSWREVVGKTPSILNSGKHNKAFYEEMWNTITSGKTWHGEIINKKKNDVLFHEEMTITPIIDDNGELTQFVAIKNDITERKKLEEILLKAKERMEDELNVAKDIQMSMLPLIFPAFPKREEVDIYAELIPAREVGGDFYDFHFIDENHICFVMGDVSGKGVPAALMMAVTKTLLKSRASNDMSTASILTHVNNEIAKDNDAYMFITVFIAILNTNTGELVYSNAGHNPSFIISKNKELTKLKDLHGPVVGAMEEMTYGETKLFLKKNDIVLSFTDGVTESQNIKEELYSDARFEELLEKGDYNTPETLTKLIIGSVKEFEGEADQFDDITVMALEYSQNPSTVSSIKSSIKIKNNLKQITTAIEWFEIFALENKMPFGIIQKINIAFDELLNNIISYGYNDDKIHEIKIEIELRGERLIIIFNDDGIPFNPFKKDPPDTMLSIEERIIGGLGIHLVRKLMDECEYKRHTNKNIITLIKHNINQT